MDSNTPLYKYYPPSRIENIFKKWTIRFTPISDFNDPFEGLIAFDDVMNEEIYNSYPLIKYSGLSLKEINNLIVTEEDKKILSERIRLGALSRFGIFCLTTNPNNLLMWSHYAEGHKGFVIKFNIKSDFFTSRYKDRMWKPHAVIYKHKRQLFKNINDICDDKLINFLTTKASIWEYEHEYRMFCSYIDKESECYVNNVRYPIKGIHSLPKSAVSGVFLGAKMSYEDVNKIISLIRKDVECTHISIHQMSLDRVAYRLNVSKNIIINS